jgi:hypothetical protein
LWGVGEGVGKGGKGSSGGEMILTLYAHMNKIKTKKMNKNDNVIL